MPLRIIGLSFWFLPGPLVPGYVLAVFLRQLERVVWRLVMVSRLQLTSFGQTTCSILTHMPKTAGTGGPVDMNRDCAGNKNPTQRCKYCKIALNIFPLKRYYTVV